MVGNRTCTWRWLLLGAAVISCTQNCFGQRSSNWRVYKLADGLPESACISVTLSPQGKVLVRHLDFPSLTELDGYSAFSIPAPDIGKARVYQSPGGQLWT